MMTGVKRSIRGNLDTLISIVTLILMVIQIVINRWKSPPPLKGHTRSARFRGCPGQERTRARTCGTRTRIPGPVADAGA